MSAESKPVQHNKSSRKDIYIALIGVLGVVITAFFSNWDKIFPEENIVMSQYSGYQPSNNPETEIKYLLHITGAEEQLKQIQSQVLAMQKQQFLQQFAEEPDVLNKLYAIIEEELPRFNDRVLQQTIETQSQYFTQEEITELNKFYSTPIMREFTRRQPLLVNTLMEKTQPLVAEFQYKLEQRFKAEVFVEAD